MPWRILTLLLLATILYLLLREQKPKIVGIGVQHNKPKPRPSS